MNFSEKTISEIIRLCDMLGAVGLGIAGGTLVATPRIGITFGLSLTVIFFSLSIIASIKLKKM